MASTFLLIVVFVLDLAAFSLAVAAERRRSKATVVGDGGDMKYCMYSSDIATGLGVGALLLLMASQVLIMGVSRCLCCGKVLRPGRSRVWAIVLFISCWVTFLIAEVCLLAASLRNAYHTKYREYLWLDPPSCDVLRKGVFGAGAAFILLTGVLSEFYYVSYTKSRPTTPSHKTGVAMGSYT